MFLVLDCAGRYLYGIGTRIPCIPCMPQGDTCYTSSTGAPGPSLCHARSVLWPWHEYSKTEAPICAEPRPRAMWGRLGCEAEGIQRACLQGLLLSRAVSGKHCCWLRHPSQGCL